MNKLEKIELRSSNLNKLNEIVEKAKTEKRELTENEVVEFRNLETEIRNIDNELDNKNKNTKKMDKFSIFRAWNTGDYTEEQKEIRSYVNKSGISLVNNSIVLPFQRALTPNGGEAAIGTDVTDVQAQLTEASLINRMGGKFLAGLVSDFAIPSISNATLGWAGDNTSSANMNASISAKVLKPKRLGGYIPVDKKLLLQNSTVESALMNTIYALVDVKLSEALFGTSADTDRPSGLFVGTGHTFSVASTAVTYANILSLESKILENSVSAENVVIITTPAIAAKLKSTPKSATGIYEPILKDGKIDNYQVFVSNQVAAGVIAMVDVNSLYAGVWAVELLRDETTLADKGQDRIVVNVYADATIANDKCVVWGKLS